MTEQFPIELAFFPGFYESSLENSDTAYNAIRDELEYYYHDNLGREELTEDDLDFDYRAYEKAAIENFIMAWKDHAPKIVEDVEYDHLWSPRYYNFETDAVYSNVTLKEGWQDDMRDFMRINADWLRERIRKQWSSRDGFISFMSNNFDDRRHDSDDHDTWNSEKSWYYHLFTEKDTRYIGTMLGYMMIIENGNVRDSIIDETLEGLYEGSYVYVKAEREAQEAQGEAMALAPATA